MKHFYTKLVIPLDKRFGTDDLTIFSYSDFLPPLIKLNCRPSLQPHTYEK